mgnify:CR=1 FL=1
MMKLVFFGTPYFAIPSLNALHKSTHEICAVVTVPDKRYGRGLKKTSSPIKKTAEGLNYSIYQPPDLKDPNFLSIINKIDADIFVVVAYRILPDILISIPREGAVNIHASLLPKYRGAAPIHHAILNGDNETGLTTFLVKSAVDTGDILYQQKVKISPDDNYGTLSKKMSQIGSELLIKTIIDLHLNNITPRKQDESTVTSAPKIHRDEKTIRWINDAEKIFNLRFITSKKRKGYAKAVIDAIKLVNTKYVIFMDSDGQIDPKDIEVLWNGRNKYDINFAHYFLIIIMKRNNSSSMNNFCAIFHSFF